MSGTDILSSYKYVLLLFTWGSALAVIGSLLYRDYFLGTSARDERFQLQIAREIPVVLPDWQYGLTFEAQLRMLHMLYPSYDIEFLKERAMLQYGERSKYGMPIGQTPQSVEPAVYSSEPLDVPDTQIEDTASLAPEILGVTRHLVIEPAFGLDVRICAHIGGNPLFVHFAHVPMSPLVTVEEETNDMQEMAREHTLAMLVTARLQEDYDLALANRGIEEMCGVYVQSTMPHIKKSRSAVTNSVPTMYIKGEKPPVRGSPKKNRKKYNSPVCARRAFLIPHCYCSKTSHIPGSSLPSILNTATPRRSYFFASSTLSSIACASLHQIILNVMVFPVLFA